MHKTHMKNEHCFSVLFLSLILFFLVSHPSNISVSIEFKASSHFQILLLSWHIDLDDTTSELELV